MNTTPKEVVKNFYDTNFIENDSLAEDFFHPDLLLTWNSATGISEMDYSDMVDFFVEIKRAYSDIRVEISHLLAQDNHVTVRYKYYARTLEDPEEEVGIAHFMVIWEIKEGKLFRGYQISQPVLEVDGVKEDYKPVML